MASESVVERGARILAEQQAAAQAAADQVAAEAREQELLALGTANIVSLLTTVLDRLVSLEATVATLNQQVVASRIRRPVRDETGTIIYVVDELMGAAPVAEPDGDF